MMAKVLIPFYDKVAKVDRKKGEVFPLTADRFNEITRKGRYIEAYEDAAPAVASTDKK